MARMMPSSTAGVNPTFNVAAKTSTDSNQLTVVGEAITVTAAQLTLNALFGNVRVPKGAEIAWVMLDVDDLDTNGSPTITLSIGDTGDDDRLLTANTAGQTGAVPVGPTVAKAGFGYRYTDETLISVKVKAAPATAAGGVIRYLVAFVSQ
ncbi:MAG: hypothetical protein JHD15_07140 [Phenylobacterium sp.]|uniref:hypothetical protein n=1 Tax=Phenylobacterium sp. TaxID=1871053 RepID=UPI001A1C9E12|nr:hypothetical protein [Phenylobacterium sp.]MBJ7410128.1 hypothetical protein [Phenylobacterium sp.]